MKFRNNFRMLRDVATCNNFKAIFSNIFEREIWLRNIFLLGFSSIFIFPFFNVCTYLVHLKPNYPELPFLHSIQNYIFWMLKRFTIPINCGRETWNWRVTDTIFHIFSSLYVAFPPNRVHCTLNAVRIFDILLK